MAAAMSIKDMSRQVGRRQINHEQAIVRLPHGALERIKRLLAPDETQASFLRDVVLRELDRREEAEAKLGHR